MSERRRVGAQRSSPCSPIQNLVPRPGIGGNPRPIGKVKPLPPSFHKCLPEEIEQASQRIVDSLKMPPMLQKCFAEDICGQRVPDYSSIPWRHIVFRVLYWICGVLLGIGIGLGIAR